MAANSISSLIPLTLRRGLAQTFALLGLGTAENDSDHDDQRSITSSEEPSIQPKLSVHDVVATRDLLLTFFPPELVYIILDRAEYWAQLNSAREQSVQLFASRSPGANASLCYLVAPPILNPEQYELEGTDIHLKIRRAQFTTVSHDQGWCSDAALRGTYRGATWFEAAILRPSQAAVTGPSLNHAGDAPVGLDTALGYDPILEVEAADGGSRWELQRNFCASEEYREHVIVWEADGTTPPGYDSRAKDEADAEVGKGAGDGAGFVARLTPGDRIAVIARARYPGWSNFIQRVEVSVYYGLA